MDNWIVVCYAFLGDSEYEKKYDIHIYPMFVHCKVNFAEIKDNECYLTAAENLFGTGSSYSVETALGTKVNGYINKSKKSEIAFTQKTKNKVSLEITDKGIKGNDRIKVNLLVNQTNFTANAVFQNGNIVKKDTITYITGKRGCSFAES